MQIERKNELVLRLEDEDIEHLKSLIAEWRQWNRDPLDCFSYEDETPELRAFVRQLEEVL